ncbi:DsrE/DsrF-like family protein [Rubripirellula lacrimiformis]|uniref:DsrE/DsrF-like family protein n=1 Tax=Rubripirellula lacrimiformis TaxID=1930273 RepID=A0A517N508_9BACT|nr:DsrE family protein [Rubripirellula lacrimiformis]QDT02108.1 DsrE/DsrF-like family protein [Rubripirellula lacrimiformis]
MRRVIPLGFLAVFVAVFTSSHSGVSAEDAVVDGKGQKVVVHLSHFTDDLHRCFMAVKVANLMQEYGADVTMFVDLEGVRIAERREHLKFTWGEDSPTLAELYEKFAAGGGKVMVCPHCAHSAHITDPGLKRNAEIATTAMLGKLLIEADKVMDY